MCPPVFIPNVGSQVSPNAFNLPISSSKSLFYGKLSFFSSSIFNDGLTGEDEIP